MAYLTNADVALLLNVTLNSDGEALIDAIIPAVEDYAKSYCGRQWNRGTGNITETFDGGNGYLFPSSTPIDEIVSITEDGSAIDAGDIYNYGTHIRLAYIPSPGLRRIVVTYKSNNPLPNDLKHALIRWTADIFKAAEDAGKTVKSIGVGPLKVDFLAQDGIPSYVEMVLNRYRLQPI
jgi:hypothetical protein